MPPCVNGRAWRRRAKSRPAHPGVARSKYYSPCIDRSKILAHYREMMRKLLEIAPELYVVTFWGNDSGAGICWSR